MRLVPLAFLSLALASAANAQISPSPSPADPRLQTVRYDAAEAVRLVTFPQTSLTVILLPSDRIHRATISDRSAFDVRVTYDADGLTIRPLKDGATATLSVETSINTYRFTLETGTSLSAAYLVSFVPDFGGDQQTEIAPMAPERGPIIGSYRLSGDKPLRPASIEDDGKRTYIEWGPDQSLSAVFGIGPTGDEEVVGGYMRDGIYIIDRVYGELVFRIDKDRAKARRQEGGER